MTIFIFILSVLGTILFAYRSTMLSFVVLFVIFGAAVFSGYRHTADYTIRFGNQTEGYVTDVQVQSQRDRYGKSYVVYKSFYKFKDGNERTWGGKSTSYESAHGLKEGDAVTVFYRKNAPYHNAIRVKD